MKTKFLNCLFLALVLTCSSNLFARTASAAVPLEKIKLSCNDEQKTVKLFIGQAGGPETPVIGLIYTKVNGKMKLTKKVTLIESKKVVDPMNTAYEFKGTNFEFRIVLFKYAFASVFATLTSGKLPSVQNCTVDYQAI